MLPPIRYPLPSLIALAFLSLAAWRGEVWTRGLAGGSGEPRFRSGGRGAAGPELVAADQRSPDS